MIIQPITTLRTELASIEEKAQQEPIFLTKNGYQSLVVLSHDNYITLQRQQEQWETYYALKEAEANEELEGDGISSEDMFSKMEKVVEDHFNV